MRKPLHSFEGRIRPWRFVRFGGDPLQRLYSTFANGLPGKGLFLLRLVVFLYLVYACVPELSLEKGKGHLFALLFTLAAFAGIFLLGGLWTPFAGAFVGCIEVWIAFAKPAQWQACALAAGIAMALALLGPGAWSLDARIYGRKRIFIQNR